MAIIGKFLFRAAIGVAFFGASGGSYASDVSYNLTIPIQGDLTIAGTITTDGNLGALIAADIVSYDFSETSTSIPYTAQFNPSNSVMSISGVGANSFGVYINSSANGGGYLVSEVATGPGEYSTLNPIVLPGGSGIGHYSNCTISCLENNVTYLGTISDYGNGVGGGGPSGEEGYLVNPYSGSGITYIAGPGLAQTSPVPPVGGCLLFRAAICFKFSDVINRAWVDPATAFGYTYQMTSDSLFTEILDLPTGFLEPFTVTSPGCSIPGTFGAGQSVDFAALCGGGVSEFTVTGIDPMFDPTNSGAFPIQLAFNTPTADFVAGALGSAVPEPATWP